MMHLTSTYEVLFVIFKNYQLDNSGLHLYAEVCLAFSYLASHLPVCACVVLGEKKKKKCIGIFMFS